MKKALITLMALLIVTIGGLSFAQEDWMVHDTEAGTITLYSPDGSYGIVIMDKNLGATDVGGGTGLDVGTYGNYYQWGNNYGFPSDPNATVTVSSTKVDASGYGPENPYSSSTFIKACYNYNNWCSDWSSVRNDNLRGGEGDDETNGWGLTSNNPITGRQGPCPEGYHVPSVGEIDEFIVMWYNHKYNANLPIGSLISEPTIQEEGINVAIDFSKDIFMPFASLYWGDEGKIETDYYNIAGQFWSSSAYSYMGFTLSLTLRNGKTGIIKNAAYLADDNYRSTAISVRCFKNEKIIANPDGIVVTFDVNGGDSITAESVTVALGDTLDISSYSGTKDGWEFVGWNTNPSEGVAMSNPVVRGPMTLYAIYEKEVNVTYVLGDGVDSIGSESDTCLMNKVEIGCNVLSPSITPSKIGYSGIRSNGNVVVNPNKRITLTGDDTYTAGIIPNTYKVHFYSSDGAGNMSDQSFTYDTPQKLRKNGFTREGYIFSGWIYGGVPYRDKQLVNNLTSVNGKTITFTAQWKVDPGYIVYGPFYTNDGNEFMIALSTTDGTINTEVTITENPSYTESQLLEILGNDLEHTNAEIVDIEDLGGDVLFLKYPTGTKYTTVGFCSTEGGCNYFDTSGSESVTDEFKNQAMDTENVQGPTWAVSANDYIEYNEIGTSGFVVFVREGDVEGYIYVPIKKYTVTWNNPDGSNLRTDVNIKYGTIPSYDGIPEKPADDAYTYAFSGWNPEISTVVGDIVYTAEYTPTLRQYTIRFLSETGDVLSSSLYDFGTLSSNIILPTAPEKEGHNFNGWPVTDVTGDMDYIATYTINQYTIRFILGNEEPDILVTGDYGTNINIPADPIREGYTFEGWDGVIPVTIPAENKTIYAKWKKIENNPSGGSSGGGGRGRNSKAQDESQENNNGVDDSETDDNDSIYMPDVVNYNPDLPDDQQTLSDGLTPEMYKAYEFAYKHGITSMPSILYADMFGPLNRISMAKMLSYYAINVLNKIPDTSIGVPDFPDITGELNEEYGNAVVLAYQLGIMGININIFRPFDLVPRSEFGTALSRMLYQTSDGKYERTDEYYTLHFNKLKEEGIISVLDPYMEELRGYVMVMLMRSAKK